MIEQRVVIPIEIRCGVGEDARANLVLRSMLLSFCCVVFHELIVKEIPGGGLAVEFGDWGHDWHCVPRLS